MVIKSLPASKKRILIEYFKIRMKLLGWAIRFEYLLDKGIVKANNKITMNYRRSL
jgi:hypothetical protein